VQLTVLNYVDIMRTHRVWGAPKCT